MTRPLDLLLGALPGAVALASDDGIGDRLVVSVRTELWGGAITNYKLEIMGDGETGAVKVREYPEERLLPDWCVERHIASGGYFCLGWESTAAPKIVSSESAAVWWQQLEGFLHGQNIATQTGQWPEGKGWPHGVQAAEAQYKLETLLETLPDRVREAIVTRTVHLTYRKDKLLNRKRTCPCGKGVPVKRCHEVQIVSGLRLAETVRLAEADFWKGVRLNGRHCCKTMQNCPLRGQPRA